MRDHLKRLAPVAAALAVSSVVAASPSMAAVSAGRPAARLAKAMSAAASAGIGAASGRADAVAARSARPLLLVTGEQVWTGPVGGGVRVTGVRPAAGVPYFVLLALNCAGRIEVPADALPYLGRGLDPSLFDLASLRRAEAGGRLPVRVGYRVHVPALPGVTLTRAGHGTADGYLTARSARLFGAALARQFRADHADAGYGRNGMFASGVSIALAGATAPRGVSGGRPPVLVPRARPDFPMHTLIVDGTNLAGKPDTGDAAVVFNTDNCLRLGDPEASVSPFFRGQTRFSVPSGHYLAMGLFITDSGAGRLAFLTRFVVRQDTTVHLHEPAGGTKITMVTPRPAVAQDTDFTLLLHQRSGSWLGIEAFTSGVPLWVAGLGRAGARTAGLQTYTAQDLFSPAHHGSSYVYELNVAGPAGVVPRQHFVIKPDSLATVTNRFYQDVPSQGFWASGSAYPLEYQVLGFSFEPFPLALPGSQISYLTGGRSLDRFTAYWPFPSFNGQITDDTRSFTRGERATIDWNRYPLHAGINANPIGRQNTFGTVPSASRAGDTLTIDVTPFSDNTPGHFGSGFCPYGNTRISGTYEIDQNGAKIAAGTAAQAAAHGFCDVFASVRLSHRPSTIRLSVTARRTGRPVRLSTASRTTWTWRSRRHPGATVPPGWFCVYPSRRCAVEPMMTLRYIVHGESLTGGTRPGRQTIGLRVGHIQLAKGARITSARVSVSFNDGRTWQRARVVRTGAGRFRVALTAPPGAYVTLRASAADAAGGSVMETITRAYRVAQAHRGGVRPSDGTLAAYPDPQARRGGVRRGDVMRAACPVAPAGSFRCFALFRPQTAVNAAIAAGRRGPSATPAGIGAKQIESAYKLPVSINPHQTVAVVDAFSTPHLASLLAVYRRQFGLPPCTVSSGCLRIVNQRGRPAPLPQSGVPFGWDVETMLDVSMVSAACPLCHILVVEGDDDTFGSLAAAEDTAVRLGAATISNSYGVDESGLPLTFAKSYEHPGHAIVVSSGDSGFTAAEFPADVATVTAVGGTKLVRAHNARGWVERVWNDFGASGSGCSSYIAKPSWQNDPHCGMRTIADVAAVASNLAVYDPYAGGWLTVDGTSASAPIVAGVYGLAGNAAKVAPGYLYRHAASLFDITKGNNDFYHQAGGATCGYDYLCVAKHGYDAPTGLGTPDGIGAF